MSNSLQLAANFFKGSIAISLAWLILGVSLLSLSPEQHRNIHHEAGIVGHTCILTLFSSGSLESSSTDPIEFTQGLTAAVDFPHFKEEAPRTGFPFRYLARAPPSSTSTH